MQRVARGLFQRFQVEYPALAPCGKHDLQQPPYFLGDFLLDRCGRFFFLRTPCGVFGHRTQPADRRVDFDEAAAPLLKPSILADLAFRLAPSGGTRQRLGHRFAGGLGGELGATGVARVAVPRAMAGRLAAAFRGAGNGPRTKISELNELPQQLGSVVMILL